MRYCYICNHETLNAWVCQPCVNKHNPFVEACEEGHNYNGLPERATPYDPVPEWIQSKYYSDPDLEVDEGL